MEQFNIISYLLMIIIWSIGGLISFYVIKDYVLKKSKENEKLKAWRNYLLVIAFISGPIISTIFVIAKITILLGKEINQNFDIEKQFRNKAD